MNIDVDNGLSITERHLILSSKRFAGGYKIPATLTSLYDIAYEALTRRGFVQMEYLWSYSYLPMLTRSGEQLRAALLEQYPTPNEDHS